MTNIAAIIIDMQECFLKDVSIDRRNELIDNQLFTLDYLMSKDIPIIAVEMLQGGRTVKPLFDKLKDYSEFSRFNKSHCDAFNNKHLIHKLYSKEIDELFMMGLYANACVYESAVHASKKFKVHVSDTTQAMNDRVLKNYDSIDKRKESFLQLPTYGNKTYGVLANLYYHDNHKEFVVYSENI